MTGASIVPIIIASQNASRVAMNGGSGASNVSDGCLTFIVTLVAVGVLGLALYLIDRFL